MRQILKSLAVIALVAAASAAAGQAAAAKPCVADNRTRVLANDECLVIRTYGEPAERTSLVIFIHGDGYRGGPSDYMYRIARYVGAKGVIAIGLIRPGYYDSSGNRSTGNSYRKGDNYRLDVIETVAAAVKALKLHFDAELVVLVGHSGGSAISGVIIGRYPGLVDAAVLGACPCNVSRWRIMRRGRNNWRRSLSPHDFVDRIDAKMSVVAITGGKDKNTKPVLARDYVTALKANRIDATFIEVPGVGHNGIVRTRDYISAISNLLEVRS
ncbi:MAG: alpha/beta hydrolase family protein [Hyphomicrobiaceae bacterium]